MNILLFSISERTREIGLRLALGAKDRDILGQFLIEAAALALLGAGLGVAAGVGLTWLVARETGLPALLAVEAIWYSVGISAAIGLIFVLVPAVKASRLDPIEALRHE